LNNVLVLYHAGCPDGFGSAWSFYQKYGDSADYIPVKHGKSPPSVKGKSVFIVDFSYPRSVLEKMNDEAQNLVLLDHHKTAEKELSDLSYCHFDMNHSGAYLSWKYLFGEESVPLLIRYVEDRDLWLWKLPFSEEILSVVDSYQKTFSNWNMLADDLADAGSDSWKAIFDGGRDILRYKNALISSLIKKVHTVNIRGESIKSVNSSFFQSEIGNILSEGESYAAVYYWNGENFIFSLRSKPDRADVSRVAKIFGGGGHRNASGFIVSSLNDLK
jgi:uncharacterized protein